MHKMLPTFVLKLLVLVPVTESIILFCVILFGLFAFTSLALHLFLYHSKERTEQFIDLIELIVPAQRTYN